MKYITTQAEIDAEKALHPNQTKYKLFTIKENVQNVIECFWSVSKENAYEHLLDFRRNVKADDIYFDIAYGCISQNDNGTVTVYDSFSEMLDDSDKKKTVDELDDDTPYERIKREKAGIVKDIKFFIDHYDSENRSSHMLSESWSLDSHILDDIEFNIPIIKAEANGVPNEFIVEACEKLSKDYNKLADDKYSYDEAFDLAKSLWHKQLDNMLHHIWLYEYYSDYGILDDDISAEKKEFLKHFEIPMEKGKFNVVDYDATSKLVEAEWKEIWEWMIKYGRSLWT